MDEFNLHEIEKKYYFLWEHELKLGILKQIIKDCKGYTYLIAAINRNSDLVNYVTEYIYKSREDCIINAVSKYELKLQNQKIIC